MSITHRIRPDSPECPDIVLVEPEIANLQIDRLLSTGNHDAIRDFCEVLLLIKASLDAGEPSYRIVNTIDLYLELAWLFSAEYSASFDHFLKLIGGNLKPGETLDFTAVDAGEPAGEDEEEEEAPRSASEHYQRLADKGAELLRIIGERDESLLDRLLEAARAYEVEQGREAQ